MRRFHELSADEYARLDIAEVNLECAEGLPGSETLNVNSNLAMIDAWAEQVASATYQAWRRFERNPGEFENSETYFRMLVFVTVLQRDLGVAYNLASLDGPYDATDSRLHFIHGILEGCGGTCTTLPVLYIAVGRRLGYPLKLVQAVEHLFVRWDDEATGEKLNIEATSRGLNCRPDEYYRSWPKPARPQDIESGTVLKSMTPHEELALFYELRARCFLDWGKFRSALELAHYADQLTMERDPFHAGFHAVATVLYRQDANFVRYDFDPHAGVVLDKGRLRPMEPWEPWAVNQAREELLRIKQVHQRRCDQAKDQSVEEVFSRVGSGQDYL